MADGAATVPPAKMDASFWAALGEMARQNTDLAKQVGSVAARVDDRVTHKELMQTIAEFRKEFAGKLDHMEAKFDSTVEKVDNSLNRAVDRIKESLGGLATDSVTKAMNIRREQENDALVSVARNDAEIERKIRAANRAGVGGIGVGVVSIGYAIWQSMGAG